MIESGSQINAGLSPIVERCRSRQLNETFSFPPSYQRMETGFLISAASVAAVVLAERFVSVGWWDWDQELRSAGPCMTMHIGDQHIDAYWVIAVPFIIQFSSRLSLPSCNANPSDSSPNQWQPDANAFRLIQIEAPFFAITWRWLKRCLRCLLLLVVAYAIFATMSRATIVSALVAAIVLVIAQATYFNRSFRAEVHVGTRPLTRKFVYGLGGLLGLACLVSVALILWNSGEAVPKRFASTAEGLQARVSHWQTVLEMASGTQSRLWLGTYVTRKRIPRMQAAKTQSGCETSMRLCVTL